MKKNNLYIILGLISIVAIAIFIIVVIKPGKGGGQSSSYSSSSQQSSSSQGGASQASSSSQTSSSEPASSQTSEGSSTPIVQNILKLTGVKIVNEVLVWDKNHNASSYKITITRGAIFNHAITAYNKDPLAYALFDKLETGKEYKITVQAIGGGAYKNSKVVTLYFTPAPAPVTHYKDGALVVSGLRIANQTLLWNENPYATNGFTLTIAGQPVNIAAGNLSYSVSALTPGDYTATLVAKSAGTYSQSAPISVTFNVPKYNQAAFAPVKDDNNIITFNYTPAAGYSFTVIAKDGVSQGATGTVHGSVTTFNLSLLNALLTPGSEYTFTIKADATATYNESNAASFNYTVPKLNLADSTITVNTTTKTISWTGVANATGYTLALVDPKGTPTTREFGADIRSFYYGSLNVPAGAYTFALTSKGGAQYNDNTQQSQFNVPFIQLGEPNATLYDGLLKWGEVAGAGSYRVRIKNGDAIIGDIDITQAPFEYDIYSRTDLVVGTTYTVDLTALASPDNYLPYATTVSFNYTEKALRVSSRVNLRAEHIQHYLYITLKQDSVELAPLSAAALTDPNTYYTAYLSSTAADERLLHAEDIRSDVIATYYYMDGATPTYLLTTGQIPLVKNKLWDGWLWPQDSDGSYPGGLMGTSTEMPGTSVGATVVAGKRHSTSTNIGTAAYTDGMLSLELDTIKGKTLYVQVDVIITDSTGTVLHNYVETTSVNIPASW